MQTEMPFFESPEDALKSVIQHTGGVKRIGPMLFPDKTVDAAARYLLDCLNADRPEKLSITQIMMVLRLAHEAGHHTAYAWISGELGYEIKPITRAEEVDRLATVVDHSSRTLAAALATLERIQKGGNGPVSLSSAK